MRSMIAKHAFYLGRLNLFGLCWVAGCFAVGGLLLAKAAPNSSKPGTPKYATKNIEDVRAGDAVWAYDTAAGTWSPRQVVRPLTHEYEGDVIAVAAGGQKIEATGNHPFWVVRGEDLSRRPAAEDVPQVERAEARSGRWVEARHLQPGDLLLLRNGEVATVEELASRRREKLKVYNLEVAGLHTYAVSDAGVVVHNKAMSNSGPNGPYDVVGPPQGPTFPNSAAAMDDMMGFQGRRIPDTAATPGRGKVEWRTGQNSRITGEQHPYHPNAPDWHRDWHYHVDTSGLPPHSRYVPGDPLPGS